MNFKLLLSVHLLVSLSEATKPPGYVEKPKPHDPNPPNYNFSYSVADHSGGQQGHLEKRTGEHTEGHYYVEDPKESASQEVRYSADDWGFHPLVTYSAKTPSGHYSARFALGEQPVNGFEQSTPKGTTPLAPLLAGTVLPAGTNTDGFIHYDNKNGVKTHHPMALQLPIPAANALPQQAKEDPGHQAILQLVPVLPTIPQPQFYENPPLTTVLSPVHLGDYQYVQNIHSSPNGEVQYYSNINGKNSKSSINVQFGPIVQSPKTNSIDESSKPGNDEMQKDYDYNLDGDEQELPIPEGLISESINAGITGYDSETFGLHSNVGFGSKLTYPTKPKFDKNSRKNSLNKKIIKPLIQIATSTTPRPVTSFTLKPIVVEPSHSPQYSRLVESTQNLVSNEDLLNINGAVEPFYANKDGRIDETAYINSEQHQNTVTIKPSPTVFTLQGTVRVADNPAVKKPSGAGIISIEHAAQYRNTHGDVFKSPIVVADFDTLKNSVPSTSATYLGKENYYPPTQNTIEIGSSNRFEYFPINSYTKQPLSTTILVTPRPVSQKFLAPLNAGLRLVTSNNVEKFLDCSNSSDIKHVEDEVVEQENIENNALKTAVELFKALPVENVNSFSQSDNSTLTQVKQLADNLKTQQINSNNIQEYPSALEDSKRIQQQSSEQLYHFGAQQVLIHPAEQQNQLAAEELHQQLEESQEETLKQGSQQSQYVQRGVDKDQAVLHYPTNQLPTAQPLLQQPVYQNVNIYNSKSNLNKDTSHGASYSISVQHHGHAQSTGNHQANYAVEQNIQSTHVQPQQYLIYGAPQQTYQSYSNAPESYHNGKEIPVPYVSNYDVKSVPYYTLQHQNIVQKAHPVNSYASQQVPVHYPYIVQPNLVYAVPVQQFVEKKVPYPVEVKVPVKVEVPKPYPVEKIIEKPIEVTKYVNTPYPVHVEKIVEKKIPYPVEIQVPVKVEVSKPYPVPVQAPSVNYAVTYTASLPQAGQQVYSVGQNNFLPNGWAIGHNLNQQFFSNVKQVNQPVKSSETSKYPPIADSYYRKNLGPYGQSHTYNQQTTYLVSVADSAVQHSHNVNSYYKNTPQSKPLNDYWNSKNNVFNGYSNVGASNTNHGLHSFTRYSTLGSNQNNYYSQNPTNPHFRFKKEREAKGLRVEYGFKPPLIPSLEIDLEGRPIKKDQHSN